MQIRLKHRVHMEGKVFYPGELVEVSDLLGESLIQSGNAQSLAPEGSKGEGKDHTLLALRQTQEQRDEAEKEVLALRHAKTALEKQVAALKEALKKARATPPQAEKPEGT